METSSRKLVRDYTENAWLFWHKNISCSFPPPLMRPPHPCMPKTRFSINPKTVILLAHSTMHIEHYCNISDASEPVSASIIHFPLLFAFFSRFRHFLHIIGIGTTQNNVAQPSDTSYKLPTSSRLHNTVLRQHSNLIGGSH